MSNDDTVHDDAEHDESSSPRSFAHLAALEARLPEFCKEPDERKLAYLQATVGDVWHILVQYYYLYCLPCSFWLVWDLVLFFS